MIFHDNLPPKILNFGQTKIALRKAKRFENGIRFRISDGDSRAAAQGAMSAIAADFPMEQRHKQPGDFAGMHNLRAACAELFVPNGQVLCVAIIFQ